MDRIRIALAQMTPKIGDLVGNADKVIEARRTLPEADLVVFPELFSCGYIPEDLLWRYSFIKDNAAQIDRIRKATADGGPDVVIGSPVMEQGKLYNSIIYMTGGEIRAVRSKFHLPQDVSDGVFDEKRWFKPAKMDAYNFVNFDPVIVRGIKIGFPCCQDIWSDRTVTDRQTNLGAQFMISINASPYCSNRLADRHEIVKRRVWETNRLVAYLNTVHCIDELVMDGSSFAFKPGEEEPCLQMPQFEESLREFVFYKDDFDKWDIEAADSKPMTVAIPEELEADYRACAMGMREYVHNNGFGETGVVLGLSGGIDSAVVAMLATDALGADKVECLMLPYRYTSSESLRDAQELADNLGVKYEVVPIEKSVQGIMDTVGHWLDPENPGITEENIQARVRAVVILARSNKKGSLMLNTSCYDEGAVGFATYLADASGGWGSVKNIRKSEMYEFAKWRNANFPEGMLGPKGEIVPRNIIERPPSAELAPGQKDSDILPEYEILGPMLDCLITRNMSVSETAAETGFDKKVIADIEHRIFINEFKRRQAPVGPRILRRNNFGKDRRYPITNLHRST